MRDERTIREELNDLDPEVTAGSGSNFPGMSYEQGVDAALRWALGDTDERPMSE